MGTASAHDSEFTGHYTLTGVYWQLNYLSASNYEGNCDPITPGYFHYHNVNHNYRSVPNQGPYYFQHQRQHYVSCTRLVQSRKALGRGPLKARAAATAPPISSSNGNTQERVDEQRASTIEVCRRFGLFCGAYGAGKSASEAVQTVRAKVPVTVLRLEPLPTLGNPDQTVAQRSQSAGAGQCVVSVLDAEGLHFPKAGTFNSGLTLEVADPSVASRLGHPC